MKNEIKKIAGVVFLTFLCFSCTDILERKLDTTVDESQIYATAQYFCAPLMNAYSAIPNQFPIDVDKLTDNAVDNTFAGDYYNTGIGALRPDNNPLNNWKNCYNQIRSLNAFIPKLVITPGKRLATPVRFYSISVAQDSIDNIRELQRVKGESYFLRAFWRSELLKNFAGKTEDGLVLGYPMVGNKVLDYGDDLNIPRGTYADCVNEIVADCDSAAKYLPAQYTGTDRVVGQAMNGRASGVSALALKARVLLYAASPAYNPTNDQTKWVAAAQASAAAIKAVGGIGTALASYDNYYFAQLNNQTFQIRDILFRTSVLTGNRDPEINNYPNAMFGNASTGVSQNFVDAFPDANGYPISQSTTYSASNPYSNRDPRLAMYVAYNGTTMGKANYYTIKSYVGGADAYLPSKNTSRTSYYLKKLLRTNTVDNRPNMLAGTSRARIILGLPELYLNYCEAAAHAWGVKSDPDANGFTAYDVLLKIQARYGGKSNYLNTVIGTDVNKFIEYVLNERRLELAFEGHYFYDLRRNISDNSANVLNVDVKGMQIVKNENNTFTYNVIVLEKRKFPSPYLPIPYVEIANSPAILQNAGWK
jgi:hypothetical protein